MKKIQLLAKLSREAKSKEKDIILVVLDQNFRIFGFRIRFFKFLKNCHISFGRFWKNYSRSRNQHEKLFRTISKKSGKESKFSRKIELLAKLPKNVQKNEDSRSRFSKISVSKSQFPVFKKLPYLVSTIQEKQFSNRKAEINTRNSLGQF